MLRALAFTLIVANLALFLHGSGGEVPAPQAATETTPGPARPAPRRLRLLDEIPEAEPDVAPDAAHCERLGPFLSVADARAAARQARNLGLEAAVRTRRVATGAPDHQVYLPALPSLEQARRQVRELEAMGVESYVIGRPGMEGAISVGVFTARGGAEARRREISRLGYEVRIRDLERTREVWDLLLRASDAAAIDTLIDMVVGEDAVVGEGALEMQESVSCPAVA